MSTQRNRGRLRTVLVAVLLVVGALPASAGPAAAIQSCPSGATGPIASWTTVFKSRGVTLCKGFNSFGTRTAYVTIVDFAEHAKMRIVSTVSGGNRGNTNTLFTKRTAEQWFTAIEGGIVTNPPAGRLFSVTNASFFTTTSGSTTTLSFPEKTGGSPASLGWVLQNHSDPGWDLAKRRFGLGIVSDTTQTWTKTNFTTHYTSTEAQLSSSWEGLVALSPGAGSQTETRSRNMMGFNTSTSRVYILSTLGAYTLPQGSTVLGAFGSTSEIQIDGGGSTQMYNDSSPGDTIFSSRAVPDVLAVYLAP